MEVNNDTVKTWFPVLRWVLGGIFVCLVIGFTELQSVKAASENNKEDVQELKSLLSDYLKASAKKELEQAKLISKLSTQIESLEDTRGH